MEGCPRFPGELSEGQWTFTGGRGGCAFIPAIVTVRTHSTPECTAALPWPGSSWGCVPAPGWTGAAQGCAPAGPETDVGQVSVLGSAILSPPPPEPPLQEGEAEPGSVQTDERTSVAPRSFLLSMASLLALRNRDGDGVVSPGWRASAPRAVTASPTAASGRSYFLVAVPS